MRTRAANTCARPLKDNVTMLLATYNDLWRILKNTGWFGSGS